MVLTLMRRLWLIAPFSFSVIQNVVLCLKSRKHLIFLKFFSAHAKWKRVNCIMNLPDIFGWDFCNYRESNSHGDYEVFNGETWQMYNVCPLRNLRNPMHMVNDENLRCLSDLCSLWLVFEQKHWCWIVWKQSFHPHSCWPQYRAIILAPYFKTGSQILVHSSLGLLPRIELIWITFCFSFCLS